MANGIKESIWPETEGLVLVYSCLIFFEECQRLDVLFVGFLKGFVYWYNKDLSSNIRKHLNILMWGFRPAFLSVIPNPINRLISIFW